MSDTDLAAAAAGIFPVLVLTKFITLDRHRPRRDLAGIAASEVVGIVVQVGGLFLATMGELAALWTLQADRLIWRHWLWWGLAGGLVVLVIDLFAPLWVDRLNKRWSLRA